MRHKKSGRKLNRNSSHRKALFKNLAIALIENDIIKTTLPKAKELRRFVEKESGFDFAVPEQRTYGASIPGFVKKLTDWARESQEPVWGEFIDENSGKIDPEFHGMFYRTGGSYTDTSSSTFKSGAYI